jgi:predicted nucleic acid-binding protein
VRLAVDASVVIKWYVEEVHSTEAERFLDPRYELVVPDLLWSEIGNVLWKKRLRGDLTSEDTRQIVAELRRTPLKFEAVESLVEAALEIAERIGRTFYDSAYLALAERLACHLVTADRKLFNAVQRDHIAAHVLWVEDQP